MKEKKYATLKRNTCFSLVAASSRREEYEKKGIMHECNNFNIGLCNLSLTKVSILVFQEPVVHGDFGLIETNSILSSNIPGKFHA